MSEIVKIPLEQLDVGMIVVKFDRAGFSFPHYGRPFPDTVLKSYLVGNGVTYAYIRVAHDGEYPSIKAESEPESIDDYISTLDSSFSNVVQTPPEAPILSINEVTQAMLMHRKTKEATLKLLGEARFGRAFDTSAATDMMSELVSNCIKSPDAFVNMTRLKDLDNYTFTHSVNVSVLSIALGRRLGVSADEMANLGLAGLLHDVGKMMISDEIINKPGKLNEDELKIIRMHPTYGYDYLKEHSKVTDDVLFAVRHHHEKSDGSGYPDGLTEKDIPKFAKIISIADVYDAITSERSYKKGLVPSDALRIIFSWSGKHFNNTLVKFFVNIMGIYPVGTLVVLDTKELAVIFEPNKNEPMRPRILIISDSNMDLIQPTFFDLSTYNVATGAPYKTIMSAIDPREFSIDTNLVIEQYAHKQNRS
ncbi:MAG: HD-GYP domain-containing protein [Deferribacteraceae bacterium]|nr:HD-GYP domain-containing protein [Deferribacteraceae bacterium]